MRHIAYTAKLSLPDKKMVEVRIKEQTHRLEHFSGDPRNRFTFVYDGFTLRASAYPYHVPYDKNMVYVRGWDETKDEDQIRIPLDVYKRFKAAVLAYNEKYKN